MDKDNIQDLLEAKTPAEQELEKMRSAVTILFSDIEDSVPYFERKGDVAGLAMVERHNNLLIPIIHAHGGQVVKKMGDAIMARFAEAVDAIKAATGMQRALEAERDDEIPEEDQVHIRIGLHTGFGLIKDNDVFGDVVNTASRLQNQADADQILISGVLLDAAKKAGVACARLGRAEMKGKDSPIDVYAVAWSESVGGQLIEQIQTRFVRKLKDSRRRQESLEDEFETARDQWRLERRRLTLQLEELEDAAERAKENARTQISDNLHAELRFQLEQATEAHARAQEELAEARARWEIERNELQTQIASMQTTVLDAMAQVNNPARLAAAVRDQAEARVTAAKADWQLQWEAKHRQLTTEIERLKKSNSGAQERKEAARRAVLQRLGKLPPGSVVTDGKTPAELEMEFEDARLEWETERSILQSKVRQLEQQIRDSAEEIRASVLQELQSDYQTRLSKAQVEQEALARRLATETAERQDERLRLTARIEQLEQALPEARDAVRVQVAAELTADFETRIEELQRLKARQDRRAQDDAEEWESERRRMHRQIEQLQQEVKELRSASDTRRAGAGAGV